MYDLDGFELQNLFKIRDSCVMLAQLGFEGLVKDLLFEANKLINEKAQKEERA